MLNIEGKVSVQYQQVSWTQRSRCDTFLFRWSRCLWLHCFTPCLPRVSMQLLNGSALNATVLRLRLFKNVFTALVASSEHSWTELGGICIGINLNHYYEDFMTLHKRIKIQRAPQRFKVWLCFLQFSADFGLIMGGLTLYYSWIVEFQGMKSQIKTVFSRLVAAHLMSSVAPWESLKLTDSTGRKNKIWLARCKCDRMFIRSLSFLSFFFFF